MILLEDTSQFAGIARTAYMRMSEIKSGMLEIDWSAMKVPDEENTKAFMTHMSQMAAAGREAFITIVFSAIAVEALINRIGATGTSTTQFKKYLDKLDLLAKWVVVPEVANHSARINTDGKAFQLITALIKDRNQLVHSKSRLLRTAKEIQDYSVGFRPFEAAANAIETLDSIIEELGSPITDALR